MCEQGQPKARNRKKAALLAFSANSAPDEHHKIDAQVRGGEADTVIKIPSVFPWAPSCALFRPALTVPVRLSPLREAWRSHSRCRYLSSV
jgi:hypothetical protein